MVHLAKIHPRKTFVESRTNISVARKIQIKSITLNDGPDAAQTIPGTILNPKRIMKTSSVTQFALSLIWRDNKLRALPPTVLIRNPWPGSKRSCILWIVLRRIYPISHAWNVAIKVYATTNNALALYYKIYKARS